MENSQGSYRSHHTRYRPLIDYLAASSEAEMILTFPEIEAIIGGPLTDAAYVNGPLWRGKQYVYVQRWRAGLGSAPRPA